ncbi:hypothetical protein HK104_011109 [Borealophlyctis nickersoniae]|nr:hypothetical protein HK104_011109 [Borealophlyctis nickersoniae]
MFRYASPMTQVVILGLICFCCPGMFNALNGLGAAGKADATATNNANTALAVTFAVFSLVAGGVFNIIGHRLTLLLGGLTYVLYVGSYLTDNSFFVIFAGAILGVGAGFLWAAQGAIMMSYPAEHNKGKFIGVFWAIFNCGGTLGSLLPLVIEWNNGKSSVSTGTYIGFMVLMTAGALLSLALLSPSKVTHSDGTPVSIQKYSSWTAEAKHIAKLFLDLRMVLLIPLFLGSNWFYTYQFQDVNASGLFTTRARAFNGTFYWAAQILGAIAFGAFLDNTRWSRPRRAVLGAIVLFVVLMAVWSGGVAFQSTYDRESGDKKKEHPEEQLDVLHGSSYVGPFFLYFAYGLTDAMYQTFSYWLMGALTNDTQQAARFAGFYKAIQNVGGAISGQLDANKVSYMAQLIINWVLTGVAMACAIPVIKMVKDTSADAEAKGAAAAASEVPEKGDNKV